MRGAWSRATRGRPKLFAVHHLLAESPVGITALFTGFVRV